MCAKPPEIVITQYVLRRSSEGFRSEQNGVSVRLAHTGCTRRLINSTTSSGYLSLGLVDLTWEWRHFNRKVDVMATGIIVECSRAGQKPG